MNPALRLVNNLFTLDLLLLLLSNFPKPSLSLFSRDVVAISSDDTVMASKC